MTQAARLARANAVTRDTHASPLRPGAVSNVRPGGTTTNVRTSTPAFERAEVACRVLAKAPEPPGIPGRHAALKLYEAAAPIRQGAERLICGNRGDQRIDVTDASAFLGSLNPEQISRMKLSAIDPD